jgi:hypothetical protein
MRRTFAVLFTLAVALAACQTAGPVGPMPSYPPPPPPPPAGAITGHEAFTLKNGLHGSCVGLSIALMRDTPAYRDRVVKLYGSTERASLPIATVKARSARLGPAESPLVGTVQCDTQGFHFSGLAAGGYFVIARIRLGAPKHPDEDYVVLRSVTLGDGENRDVSLAP